MRSRSAWAGSFVSVSTERSGFVPVILHRAVHAGHRVVVGADTLVLAAAYREKLGGDSMDDAKAALAAYEERIGWRRA